jgi:hypothetical protein
MNELMNSKVPTSGFAGLLEKSLVEICIPLHFVLNRLLLHFLQNRHTKHKPSVQLSLLNQFHLIGALGDQ